MEMLIYLAKECPIFSLNIFVTVALKCSSIKFKHLINFKTGKSKKKCIAGIYTLAHQFLTLISDPEKGHHEGQVQIPVHEAMFILTTGYKNQI